MSTNGNSKRNYSSKLILITTDTSGGGGGGRGRGRGSDSVNNTNVGNDDDDDDEYRCLVFVCTAAFVYTATVHVGLCCGIHSKSEVYPCRDVTYIHTVKFAFGT